MMKQMLANNSINKNPETLAAVHTHTHTSSFRG